ncbi:MAG: HEAT repeat domain-containing protein [Scytonema hyalinum WJT4-NPBG1]|jgi:HEAT repeat protein|nr:HEAT repeat domain-containing protein [Scytonema hyalinum WJT4-NPBG1]
MTQKQKDVRSDSRSTEELIQIALTVDNEDTAWDAVMTLQFRGDSQVLEVASMLCESQNPQERQLGADILGQLGIPYRTFPDESLTILLRLLEREEDTSVLQSIGIALGHLHDAKAIPALVKLKNYTSESVRFGVVVGLLGYEEELAITTLIELSSDEDTEVRNWATFGLGSQIETDTTAIKEALFERFLKENPDENYEIYGEALVGLAKRKDERILTRLIEELSCDCVGVLAIEAADEMADSRLYPALMRLKEWWNEKSDLLESAISNCKGET